MSGFSEAASADESRRRHEQDKRRAGFAPAWLAMMVMIALAAAVVNSTAANASNGKPPSITSYYVTTNDSSASQLKMYNLGYSHGQNIDNDAAESVVLDFGGQNGNGGTLTADTAVTLTFGQVENLATNFAEGFYEGTGSNTSAILELGVGTNNSYEGVTTGGGSNWQSVVDATTTDVKPYKSQVIVYGANDIESWYNPNTGNYTSREDTQDWVDGFAPDIYFNYGSADNCPTSGSGDHSCDTPGDWTKYWYWWMSYGSAGGLATPEIYTLTFAEQWGSINSYKHIDFTGPWDDHPACSSHYDDQTAWDKLKTYDGGQSPQYSLQVEYENGHSGC